jgi:hypothetical protein
MWYLDRDGRVCEYGLHDPEGGRESVYRVRIVIREVLSEAGVGLVDRPVKE